MTATAAGVLALGSRVVGGAIERLGDLQRLLSFTRGRLELVIRPDDIFISSYPRSGTTWMQQIMYQLTTEGEMGFDHICQVAPWFERSLAVGALTAAELNALPSPRIFKSHLPYRWLPRGARYVYVVRDGRDVAVSYYQFYRSHLRFDGGFEQFYRRFLAGDLQYGSWFKHVAGWEAQRDNPRVLIVRFEDLGQRFAHEVHRIAGFLETALEPALLDRVAQRCSFEFMKRHESKFDFATEFLLQRGYSGQGFLRQGRVGQGTRLSGGQRDAFERRARRPRPLAELELDLPRFLH